MDVGAHNLHERVSFLQWGELFWAVDAPARFRVQSPGRYAPFDALSEFALAIDLK